MTETSMSSIAGIDVSRETIETLEAFSALVLRWNNAINLVSKSATQGLWQRHIVDSAQIFAFCPSTARHWVDVGSGGGFPGLVVAILARNSNPDLRVTLIESDQRKATFLRQAAQALRQTVAVVSQRIESVPPLDADVVSARALAPLNELLGLVEPHLRPNGVALFPKGARHTEELEEARQVWRFDAVAHSSVSDPTAAILEIRRISRGH